jgi:pimeloyl-ACP methyl ester carboxylesterase
MARERQRAIRLGHHAAGLALALRALGLGEMPDLRPHLGRVAVPVALLAGAEDDRFLAHARELAAHLPRARLQVVAGAGHNPIIERPDAVAAALNAEKELS